jgi:hypothetical protein
MNDPSRIESTPSLGVLARFYWMAIGPMIIILIAVAFMMKSLEKNVITNLVYWGLVLSVILVRYLDIRYLKGETADGEPATLKHWKRFCIILLTIYTCLWVVLICLF